MKIAGRKNDGAWFRTNKAISTLSDPEKASLAEYLIDKLEYADLFFNDILALGVEAGVNFGELQPATSDELISLYASTGIPRQVWNGKLTFTTYTKFDTGIMNASGTGTIKKYTPNYSVNARKFAKELRHLLSVWLHARRQTRDVIQLGTGVQGNPGGVADANKLTK